MRRPGDRPDQFGRFGLAPFEIAATSMIMTCEADACLPIARMDQVLARGMGRRAAGAVGQPAANLADAPARVWGHGTGSAHLR